MSHVRTTQLASLLTLLAVLITGTSWSGFAGRDPQFTYQSITPAQHETIIWALGLFDEADLELPNIHFVGHHDRQPCHGRDGAARRDENGAVVNICATEIQAPQEWVVLHEIAHTWDYHNLDDHTKTAFLELRDLQGWREGEWHERGAENAAEIIAWGLIDRPVQPGHIYDNNCHDLLAGYLTLVGEEPLHGFTEVCDR